MNDGLINVNRKLSSDYSFAFSLPLLLSSPLVSSWSVIGSRFHIVSSFSPFIPSISMLPSSCLVCERARASSSLICLSLCQSGPRNVVQSGILRTSKILFAFLSSSPAFLVRLLSHNARRVARRSWDVFPKRRRGGGV